MPRQDELDAIGKEIDDYNKGVKNFSIENALNQIMFEAQAQKNAAATDVIARRWAVFNTDLEKALGYYQAFLASKPSVEGGSSG